MIFARRTPEPEAEAVTPQFAFCEPVTATPMSKEHIRPVGPEGLKLGGGVPVPALCGRDLHMGWDLETPVTADMVDRLAAPRPGDGRVFLCGPCADAWRTLNPSN